MTLLRPLTRGLVLAGLIAAGSLPALAGPTEISALDKYLGPWNGKGQVSGLRLSALFPKVEAMKKSLGSLDGAMSMQGRGESVAQWLGSGDGSIRLYVREGTFSRQLLDLAGLNLGSVIVAKLFGTDKEVQLRCAVADFNVQNGLATPRIAMASGMAFLTAQLLDIRIFASLRRKAWWLPPFVSSVISSALDTAIFFSFAFYCGALPGLGLTVSDGFAALGLADECMALPWVSLAVADYSVKLALAALSIAPYGAILTLMRSRSRQAA